MSSTGLTVIGCNSPMPLIEFISSLTIFSFIDLKLYMFGKIFWIEISLNPSTMLNVDSKTTTSYKSESTKLFYKKLGHLLAFHTEFCFRAGP